MGDGVVEMEGSTKGLSVVDEVGATGNLGTTLAQPMALGLVSQSGGRWIKFPMTHEVKLVLQGRVIFIS